MKIAFLPGELTCTGRYFGALPAALLDRHGHDAYCDVDRLPDVSLVDTPDGPVPADPGYRDCDLVVLIRPACVGLREFVAAVKRQGAGVVHCVDDWLFGDGPRVGLYGGADGFREVLATYHDVDGFLVSTPRIGENLAVYGKPTWVQRIRLWEEHYLDLPARQETDTVTVGWTGTGWIRPGDLAPLGPVLGDLLDEFESLRFRAIGDETTLDVLGLDGHPQASWTPLVPLAQFPRQVLSLDIGLAPLERSEVNLCKTAIKVMEYFAAGVIPVAAAWQPEYAETIRHGDNGFLAERPGSWREAIARLVQDRGLRERMAASAAASAAPYWISAGEQEFVATYVDVAETFADRRVAP